MFSSVCLSLFARHAAYGVYPLFVRLEGPVQDGMAPGLLCVGMSSQLSYPVPEALPEALWDGCWLTVSNVWQQLDVVVYFCRCFFVWAKPKDGRTKTTTIAVSSHG
jgi:hypothetical protein